MWEEKMRIAELEIDLQKKSLEDLKELGQALDTSCNKLPEKMIQEMGLRTLRDLVKIQLSKKGGK